jgi:hypothetical protein
MASKNIYHSEISPELIDDLGFTDMLTVGLMMSNLDIENTNLSESKSQYDKIKGLLTTETTSDLTQVKRAFVLPMHNVSTDRLKAALKEHKISVTNDYEKADFIGSISGYSYIHNFRNIKNNLYLIPRHCSWGWGTWRRVWTKVKWNHYNIKRKTARSNSNTK